MARLAKIDTTKRNNKKQKLKYILLLYTVGKAPNCLTAFNNLKKICETHLANNYSIEIIDLLKLPELAKLDQIVAVPTVIRKSPKPTLKVIGNLSNTDEVIIGLDLH